MPPLCPRAETVSTADEVKTFTSAGTAERIDGRLLKGAMLKSILNPSGLSSLLSSHV